MARIALLFVGCLGAILGESSYVAQTAVVQPPKLTPEQQQKLKERERLISEANKFNSEGKLLDARAAIVKCLALEREVYGDAHITVAETLDWLRDTSRRIEDFPAAKEYGRKALEVRKRLHGDAHWETTNARLKLADVELRATLSKEQKADLVEAARLMQAVDQLHFRGESQKAREAAEKALALRRAVLGEKHPDYAYTLIVLGFLHQSLGSGAKAEPLYQEALAIRKAILGEKHPDYAVTLNLLARLYESQRSLAKAELLYKEVLAIRKEALGEQHPDYAASLYNLADVYAKQQLYAKAEPMYKDALVLTKDLRGLKSRECANIMLSLASMYKSQGLYAKAEAFNKAAMVILKDVVGLKGREYATSLNNLAGVYALQGLYAKAEPLYKEALAIHKEILGAKHPSYAISLGNLATFYVDQNLFAKAEPLYEEALAIHKVSLGGKHPDYATSLNNLAYCYSRQSLFAKAEPLYKESLAIRKEVLGRRHPDYATSLNNLASMYELQGLSAKAEPLYKESLAIMEEVLGKKHPGYALALNNLATLYDAQGDFSKAEPLHKEALAIKKEVFGDKHPSYALSLNNLADVYRGLGLVAKAEPLYLQTLQIMENHLEQTAAVQSEAAQLADSAASRVYLTNLLRLPDTEAAKVYATAFRWRGAVTARQTFARATRGTDPASRQTLDELREVTRRLSNLVTNPPGTGVDVPKLMNLLDTEREELETKLASQSKDFAKYQKSRQLKVADIQKFLPADAVLIDFLVYGDKIAAFIITPKSVVRVDLKATSREIAEMVNDFRSESSLKRTRPVQGEEDKSALREAVWQPLVPHLDGVKLALICPDGPLCQLPFAALRGTDPQKYLIEELAVAVIPVPMLLPELLAERPVVASSLLLVGDVDFSGDPGAGKLPGDVAVGSPTRAGGRLAWKPLEATAGEIQTIEELFRKNVPGVVVKSFTKADATEAAIRRVAGRNRYLHFATHGFFDDPKPTGPTGGERFRASGPNPGLLSGLVCAGANKPTPDDDGVLTALEIADLDLAGVELAVLSACETGLGKVIEGDGVLGLQRAFQLAGVRTTVTSLWQVPDEATGALMTRFYENRLKQGMPALKALREGQLWILNDGVKAGVLKVEPKNGRRTPPMFWAAFVLAGDWR